MTTNHDEPRSTLNAFGVNDRGCRVYYLLATVRGARFLNSILPLTVWICAACSLSWAVRVSICFCCCATVASNFSTLPLSMAWCGVGAPGALEAQVRYEAQVREKARWWDRAISIPAKFVVGKV